MAGYNSAWHLRADCSPLTPAQASIAEKNLAQIILAAACNGEREPECLNEIALRGISVRSESSHSLSAQ